MRVNQLAKELSVPADTVRYYSRIGFLTPNKSLNGYKEYSREDVQRLRFILSARQQGFSVDDIGQILDEASNGRTVCSLVRRILKERINEMEKRFFEIERLHKRMLAAVDQWDLKPDKAPAGQMVRHLIEDFMKEE